MLSALALALLVAAATPAAPRDAPDPAWTSRVPGDRRVFLPGFRRPPLILETKGDRLIYRRGQDLTFRLSFTALAWIDEAPTDFEGADWHRLWVLVHNGVRTQVFRPNPTIDCSVRVLRRVRPGDTWESSLGFSDVKFPGWVTPAVLFPADGDYHVQFIYDQGDITVESNWLLVTVNDQTSE